jgi:hypothetical protein
LVSGDKGRQVIANVVLEHGEDHAADHDLARLRLLVLVKELDVDIALVVSGIFLSKGTKGHKNVVNSTLEHEVESPARVPQFRV